MTRTATNKMSRLADRIQRPLVHAGIIVHRCDAVSTSSVYLLIDWGLGGTIRIGDHLAKNKSYRYNVYSKCQSHRVDVNGKQECSWYNPSQLDLLVSHVIQHREQDMDKIGRSEYRRRLVAARNKNKLITGPPQYFYKIDNID